MDNSQVNLLSNALGVQVTKDLGFYLGAPMLHHHISKNSYSFILTR